MNHANLIMVTSALAGEGKSFTSINLALSIAAELDHTVMLVDADGARPSVLRMLGTGARACWMCWKSAPTCPDVLLRTNKLTILPGGRTASARDRIAGQRCDAQPAGPHGPALSRPDHHL